MIILWLMLISSSIAFIRLSSLSYKRSQNTMMKDVDIFFPSSSSLSSTTYTYSVLADISRREMNDIKDIQFDDQMLSLPSLSLFKSTHWPRFYHQYHYYYHYYYYN